MAKSNLVHKSVLLKESINFLHIESKARYIDATLGVGGHSIEILRRGGKLLGIEQDPEILKIAQKNIRLACPATEKNSRWFYKLVQGNFKNVRSIAQENGFDPCQGILADLGISSLHYEQSGRGFSFNKPDEPLDMRLDPKVQAVKASDLLNSLGKKDLVDTFEFVMGKALAKWLAYEVIKAREKKKIEKVGDLLRIVQRLHLRPKDIHPATKPFMALRIRVNSELENLSIFLPNAFELLVKGGRMAIISFHSAEDRIVKRFSKAYAESLKVLTRKPVFPSSREIKENPRSRSARLRVFEKII